MSITETLLLSPMPFKGIHSRSGIAPDDDLVLEGTGIKAVPVQMPGVSKHFQWYVLLADNDELGNNVVKETSYNQYKNISSSEALREYKLHLVSIFREALKNQPYSDISVTVNSINRKLNINVKKSDENKNDELKTIAEFVIELGREGFNDFEDEPKKPKTLTRVKSNFNGHTESQSGYVTYLEGYRLDNEVAFFLERLKNKLFTKEEIPEYEKLKLTHEQLQSVLNSTNV